MARTKPNPPDPTPPANVLPFPPPSAPSANSANSHTLPSYNALTSSARLVEPSRANNPQYQEWQTQAWNFYDALEQLSYAVSWLSNMVSRVRLVAAELPPGADEPVLLPADHPASQLIARLAGGTGGQARMMKEFTIHFSVPGECWLVGESPDPQTNLPGAPAEETWTIYSADELRTARRKNPGFGAANGLLRNERSTSGPTDVYEVRVGEGTNESNQPWRILSPNSVVIKCWNAHPRWGWRADSPTRHAMRACVELDLINKRIMAMILSRLANNGIVLYDKSRMSFPGPPDPADPTRSTPGDFAQMLVDVAKSAMSDVASPASCIPIPIGFDIPDLTNVDPKLLMQHLSFSEGVDEKILALRDNAITQLATAIDLPASILLGNGSQNHWTASQAEESAIKVHVTPVVELITYSLSIGYMTPMLKTLNQPLVGPLGGRIMVWYDPSEITTRPDKSENAIAAYDRQEITGTTLRREIGVDEDDAPGLAEQVRMLLRKQATLGSIEALQVLNGDLTLADLVPTGDPGVRADTDGTNPADATQDDSTATGRPPGAPDRPPGPARGGQGPQPPGGNTPSSQPRNSRPSDTRPSA